MKVVIYTHYLKSGGAEKRASVYANYLFEHGVDVTVVTMHKVDDEYPINKNIKRIFISESFDEYKKLSKIKRLNKLIDAYESICPDYVLSFMTTYAFYSILAKRKSKKLKNMINIYCVALYQRKLGFRSRFIDVACCVLGDYVNLQCKEQIKCNWYCKRKCIVTYNPIKSASEIVLERDFSEIKAIAVGRLEKQKNFPLAMKAIKILHDEGINISLDIYGKGKLKEKLQNHITKLNADSYIKINDFTLSINDEFYKHNIFISSSRFEGFPNALVEAMMTGMVVLSTPCPSGPKEIISSGDNGIIFNNVQELVSSLKELSLDSNKCKQLSNSAINTSRNRFEEKVVLNDFAERLKLLK